jgi:hypothetical protein
MASQNSPPQSPNQSPSPSVPAKNALPIIKEDTSIVDIKQWLLYAVKEAGKGPYSEMIHVCNTRIYAFRDGQERTNWKIDGCSPDLQEYETVSEFLTLSKMGKEVKLGLFRSWPETWVGKTPEEWDHISMHAWFAVIINIPKSNGGGKMLVVWDSDAETRLNAQHERDMQQHEEETLAAKAFEFKPRERIMMGRQAQLANKVAGKRTTYQGTYYGGRRSDGKKCSLALALETMLAICRGHTGIPSFGWVEQLGLTKLRP